MENKNSIPDNSKIIWTIGHSTRTMDEFISMLKSFDVHCLVDIRSYPGSKRYPHFNKNNLEISLPGSNIGYLHLADLGGRRKLESNSKNTAWKHPAFRAYADYMETNAFKKAIHDLEELALKQNTAYMCSEALWWR